MALNYLCIKDSTDTYNGSFTGEMNSKQFMTHCEFWTFWTLSCPGLNMKLEFAVLNASGYEPREDQVIRSLSDWFFSNEEEPPLFTVTKSVF